jgi:hypothetical protein
LSFIEETSFKTLAPFVLFPFFSFFVFVFAVVVEPFRFIHACTTLFVPAEPFFVLSFSLFPSLSLFLAPLSISRRSEGSIYCFFKEFCFFFTHSTRKPKESKEFFFSELHRGEETEGVSPVSFFSFSLVNNICEVVHSTPKKNQGREKE